VTENSIVMTSDVTFTAAAATDDTANYTNEMIIYVGGRKF